MLLRNLISVEQFCRHSRGRARGNLLAKHNKNVEQEMPEHPSDRAIRAEVRHDAEVIRFILKILNKLKVADKLYYSI